MKNAGKAVVNTVSNGVDYVADKALDAWDTTTTAVSNGYNYVSGKASDAVTWTNNNVVQPTIKTVSNSATWTNNNVIQPTIKTVVNVAKKAPEVAVKAFNAAVQVGSDALENSYEATNGIAPYTKTAMDINKNANPLYWAFTYSTQQGWFKEGFDVGGFYRDDKGIYHAKQSGSLQSWEYAGYNNFYDAVFKGATDMDKENSNLVWNQDYILWAWKGDYLNLVQEQKWAYIKER